MQMTVAAARRTDAAPTRRPRPQRAASGSSGSCAPSLKQSSTTGASRCAVPSSRCATGSGERPSPYTCRQIHRLREAGRASLLGGSSSTLCVVAAAAPSCGGVATMIHATRRARRLQCQRWPSSRCSCSRGRRPPPPPPPPQCLRRILMVRSRRVCSSARCFATGTASDH